MKGEKGDSCYTTWLPQMKIYMNPNYVLKETEMDTEVGAQQLSKPV